MSAAPQKPRLLILSFSPIAADARVLKQVVAFRDDYEVTTCGYGPAPKGVAEHVEIPEGTLNRPFGPYIRLRQYRTAYWMMESVRVAERRLRGRIFDVVLADDVEAVPLALRLKPRLGVHADLHEYSPLLHEEIPAWRRRVTPYLEWICRKYVAKASSWSTVSNGLAREYQRNFGFEPELVTNATPWADLAPRETSHPIRIVHSGAGLRNRQIEVMIAAVADAGDAVSLDLYLMENEPAYVAELTEAAAQTTNVRVRPPVPYSDLIQTLHGYDLGLMLLPPLNFSYRWALPNKVFDYVQARLGVIIGPSPEMAEYVTAFGLGKIAEGFEATDLTATLTSLDVEEVQRWKEAAHRSARELSAETQVERWKTAISKLIAADPAQSDKG